MREWEYNVYSHSPYWAFDSAFPLAKSNAEYGVIRLSYFCRFEPYLKAILVISKMVSERQGLVVSDENRNYKWEES
jgi:hypothetical protein